MRRTILSLLFSALLLNVSCARSRPASTSQEIPPRDSIGSSAAAAPSLAELAQDYVEMGLPVPPKDARLVYFETGRTVDFNDKYVPDRHLVFMIAPPTPNRGPLILAGAETVELRGGIIYPAPLKPDSFPGHLTSFCVEFSFDTDIDDRMILLCIQCELAGHHEWAAALYKTAHPTHSTLEQLAWNHQLNELLAPASDRSVIYKRMVKLHSNTPEDDQSFLQELAHTIAPPPHVTTPALPMEEQVNALGELSDPKEDPPGPDHVWTWTQYCNCDSEDDADSPLSAIHRNSLAAIPALLAHLDDHRLTRHFRGQIMMCPPGIDSVKDIATEFLLGLGAFDRSHDLRQSVAALQKEVAAQGEERYLQTHILEASRRYANQFSSIRSPPNTPWI